MKTRNGYVSNSSSSSFIITNTSDKELTLLDFINEINETGDIFDKFVEDHEYYKEYDRFTKEKFIKEIISRDIEFSPKESKECTFGNEDDEWVSGTVLRYMLCQTENYVRNECYENGSGKTFNFTWSFDHCE